MLGGEVCPLPGFPRKALAALWGSLALQINHHMKVLTPLRSLLLSKEQENLGQRFSRCSEPGDPSGEPVASLESMVSCRDSGSVGLEKDPRICILTSLGDSGIVVLGPYIRNTA